ncbi:oxygen-insensitive NADPH nitroreductase [Brevibacillus laterosporus]|uniref:oxygen-insensitive NADPH nitroreductase n=1 Tax=Brevibacillus laterosporus TaxID=1465 RepID=UPI002404A284|nr:oxygen-insensitive NADPH nitroreductase [Brevibacillus laterosporus]MDF9411424.1 oxygen-insensitive NADPH nitroreductase [Brevibacillus laterosporus]
MNNIIETMLNHRSIRQYEDRPLSEEQITTIVRCAQAASTSSYIQAYSIIGITDKETKRKLAELCGNQPYVETNGHLFVFCADLHRHQVIAEMEGQDLSPAIESTEKFMVAVIDATLAAQNAALAAESMGLGICYIGGLRNQLQAVTELLDIPTHVMPLFAMTVGYPLQESSQKPRLPIGHVYHQEKYNPDKQSYQQQLQEYNATISSYYQERTQGERSDTWTGQMANMLSKPARMYMKEFVEKQGLNKK